MPSPSAHSSASRQSHGSAPQGATPQGAQPQGIPPRVGVIINPAAGHGRGRRLARRVRKAFAAVGVHDVWQTTHRGHERELAERAISRGYETLAVVGGDGTLSQVANAILAKGAMTRLAPIAAGSGNDFVRSLGIPAQNIRAIARACVEPEDRRIDVGVVENEYFLNSCGFGFDVAVLQAMARSLLWRGRLSYLLASLRQLRAYSGFSASIGDGPRFRHLLIVAANASRFGGSFRIAPDASVYDGSLDLIELWIPRTTWIRFKILAAALRGRHVRYQRSVRMTQAGTLTVRFDSAPMCQTDGEVRQLSGPSVTVRCVPRALRVVGAPAPLAVPVPAAMQRIDRLARLGEL